MVTPPTLPPPSPDALLDTPLVKAARDATREHVSDASLVRWKAEAMARDGVEACRIVALCCEIERLRRLSGSPASGS